MALKHRLNNLERKMGGRCYACVTAPMFRVSLDGKVDPAWLQCPECGRQLSFKLYLGFDPDEVIDAKIETMA